MRLDDVSARNRIPAGVGATPAAAATALTDADPEASAGLHPPGALPRDQRPASPSGAPAGVRAAMAGLAAPSGASRPRAGRLAAVAGLVLCLGAQGARAQSAEAVTPPAPAVSAVSASKKPLDLNLSRAALAAALSPAPAQQTAPLQTPAVPEFPPLRGGNHQNIPRPAAEEFPPLRGGNHQNVPRPAAEELPGAPRPTFKNTTPALAAAMDRLAAAILEAVGPGAFGGPGWNVGHPARLPQQALSPAQRDLLVHGVRDALMSTPVAALSPSLLDVVKSHMLKEGLPVDKLDTLRLDELDTALRDIIVSRLLTWENERPASFYAAVAGVVGFLAGTSYVAGTGPYDRLGLEPDVRIKLFDGGLALRGHGAWEPRLKNPRLELGIASRNNVQLNDVDLRSEVRLSVSLAGPSMGRLRPTGYVLGGRLDTPVDALVSGALRSSINLHLRDDGRLSRVDGAAELLREHSKLALRASYDASTHKFSPSLSYGYTERTPSHALSVSAQVGLDANGKAAGGVLLGLQF